MKFMESDLVLVVEAHEVDSTLKTVCEDSSRSQFSEVG